MYIHSFGRYNPGKVYLFSHFRHSSEAVAFKNPFYEVESRIFRLDWKGWVLYSTPIQGQGLPDGQTNYLHLGDLLVGLNFI